MNKLLKNSQVTTTDVNIWLIMLTLGMSIFKISIPYFKESRLGRPFAATT